MFLNVTEKLLFYLLEEFFNSKNVEVKNSRGKTYRGTKMDETYFSAKFGSFSFPDNHRNLILI